MDVKIKSINLIFINFFKNLILLALAQKLEPGSTLSRNGMLRQKKRIEGIHLMNSISNERNMIFNSERTFNIISLQKIALFLGGWNERYQAILCIKADDDDSILQKG